MAGFLRRVFRRRMPPPAGPPTLIMQLPLGVPQGGRGVNPMPLAALTIEAFRSRVRGLTMPEISGAVRSAALAPENVDLAVNVALGRVANVLASMPPLDEEDASTTLLTRSGHAAYALTRVALGTERLTLRYSATQSGGIDGCVARLLTRSSTIDPSALDHMYDPAVYRTLLALTRIDGHGPEADAARKATSLVVMSGVGIAIAEMELYGLNARTYLPPPLNQVIDLRDRPAINTWSAPTLN